MSDLRLQRKALKMQRACSMVKKDNRATPSEYTCSKTKELPLLMAKTSAFA